MEKSLVSVGELAFKLRQLVVCFHASLLLLHRRQLVVESLQHSVQVAQLLKQQHSMQVLKQQCLMSNVLVHQRMLTT